MPVFKISISHKERQGQCFGHPERVTKTLPPAIKKIFIIIQQLEITCQTLAQWEQGFPKIELFSRPPTQNRMWGMKCGAKPPHFMPHNPGK
jgi:hypothetical protein